MPTLPFSVALHKMLPYLISLVAIVSLYAHNQVGVYLTWTSMLWCASVTAARIAYVFSCEKTITELIVLSIFFFQMITSCLVAYLGFAGLLGIQSLVVSVQLIYLSIIHSLPRIEVKDFKYSCLENPGKARLINTLAITMALTVSFLVIVRLLNSPIQDSDNMWYHLPMIAEWLSTGTIWPTKDTPIPTLAIGYPGHREAMMTFLSSPFMDDNMGWLIGLEIIWLWLLVFRLIMQSTNNEMIGWSFALAAICMPICTRSLTGNDITLTASTACAVLFSLKAINSLSIKDVFLAACALGMIATSKYSGVVLASLIVTCLVACNPSKIYKLLFRGHNQYGILTATLAGLLLLPLPWYLRNIIFWKNPLFPANLSFAGLTLFEGPVRKEELVKSTLGLDISPLLQKWWFFFDAFGFAFLWMMFFVLTSLLYCTSFKKKMIRNIQVPLVLSITFFIAFLHQPFNKPSFSADYNLRYLLPCAVILLWGAGIITAQAQKGVAYCSFMNIILSAYSISHFSKYFLLVFLFVVLIFCSMHLHRISSLYGHFHNFFTVVTFGLISLSSYLLNSHRDNIDYIDIPSMQGWAVLANYTKKEIAGGRILVTGDDRFFPFYGRNFSNKVFLLAGDRKPKEIEDYINRHRITHIIYLPRIDSRSLSGGYTFSSKAGENMLKNRELFSEPEIFSEGAFISKCRPSRNNEMYSER